MTNIIQEANLIDLLCANGSHSEVIEVCNGLIKMLEGIREEAVENAKKESKILDLQNSINYKYHKETENA